MGLSQRDFVYVGLAIAFSRFIYERKIVEKETECAGGRYFHYNMYCMCKFVHDM
jgi:hypothetical protein